MLVARARRVDALEIGLLLLVLLLVVSAVLVVLDPGAARATVNMVLDAVFATLSTLIPAAVAVLAFGRYREGGDPTQLLRSSAFGALAAWNLLVLTAMLVGLDRIFGLALEEPGQWPVVVGLVTRLVAAALLVLAGAAALGATRLVPRRGLAVAVAPAATILLLGIAAALNPGWLPHLVSDVGLAQLERDPTMPLLGDAASPVLVAAQGIAGILYLVAATLSYRLYRSTGLATEAMLAVGLTLAAFSQVHFAVHPSAYEGLVTTGDLVRVSFYSVLLAALVVESRTDVRSLRLAHADLRRLRDAELASAALEERARLAREIHDGLAQDLWYAKLKQSRLLGHQPAVGEARELASEVADALDAALAEARQAVMALRPQLGEGSFGDVLRRYVEDFGDRFGLRADLDAPPELPTLAPRAQAEVLRILQEAMNNVRKHADATVVRVRVRPSGDGVRFEVADNGRGFDPDAVADGRYGLHSMRERAELIGGRLGIESQPRDGTRVWVEVATVQEAG